MEAQNIPKIPGKDYLGLWEKVLITKIIIEK